MAESKLQRRIISDLRRSGWYVVKVVMSNVAGIPDIWAGRDGRTVWIEAKDEKKKARPLQTFRHKELADHGFDTFVVDSWESYLAIKYNRL